MHDTEIKQLFDYAALGWHLVPLHGLRADGSCTCGKKHLKSDGKTPDNGAGKHPTYAAWKDVATCDEEKIVAMFSEHRGNVGVLLGPASGIIDVEFDDEQGRATADKLFSGLVTPTYKSGRSVHRLFQWSPELPDEQKAYVRGLEIRIGGGGKSTQSVLPPSKHWSGTNYEWLPGLSPAECEPAELPREVLVAIVNNETHAPQGTGLARLPFEQKITEGNRDNTMLAFASKYAHNSHNIHAADEQLHLWEIMVAINATKFDPPLDEDSLKRLHGQAVKYASIEQVNNQRHESVAESTPAPAHSQAMPLDAMPEPDESEASVATQEGQEEGEVNSLHPDSSYRQWGLTFNKRQGWRPGAWTLTIIESDPVTYQLTVPAWSKYCADGAVYLTADQLYDASLVAKAVLSQTKSIDLREFPRVWPMIWNGKASTKQSKLKWTALRKQLLDAADRKAAAPTTKRFVVVGEYLLAKLDSADPANQDNDAPDENGYPKRMTDGTVWFAWNQLWEDGLARKLFTPEDVQRVARMARIGEQDYRRWKFVDKRPRYCVLTHEHLQRLHRIVGYEEKASDGSP